MFPASFGYFAARSVEEALDLLARHGEDAKLLAGGHSLIPAMKLRLARPRCLIDLGSVSGLRGIRVEADALVIGALTVHADILSSDLVHRYLPGLADAASVIGDLQVRNRGTIGGSVAHNDPGADFPVILTALDASFTLVSASGRRAIAADDFFTDFFTTALAANEVLSEIRIPLPVAGMASAYHKMGHPASGYVVVSAGARVSRNTSGRCATARVAIGGLTGGARRAAAVESALQGQPLNADTVSAAATNAAKGMDPDDDVYASADYKRHMAAVLAERAIESAVQRIESKDKS